MKTIQRTERARILIAYYSLSGNTARVAKDLAKLIGGDIESIRDREHGVGFLGYLKAIVDALRRVPAQIGPLSKNPADYALTIIGTPVWVGNMTPAVRAYLQNNQERLHNVAFFITSGGTDATKVVPAMEAVAGSTAIAFKGFDARELQDPHVYNRRIAEFASDVERNISSTTDVAA